LNLANSYLLAGDCTNVIAQCRQALNLDHNSAAGIYLAAVQVVTNRDRAWAQALATPQVLMPMAPTVAMVTNGVRNMA